MRKIWATANPWPATEEDIQAAAEAGATEIVHQHPDFEPGYHEIDVETVDQKLAKLANRRWEATQTFVYDGVRTPADGAIPALTGAIVALQMPGAPETVTWKLGKGEFRVWSLSDLIVFGTVMRQHIQSCFDHEAELSVQILNNQDPDINIGWP